MDPNTIDIYGKGVICTSVCAHPDMTAEEVAKMTNAEHPTGIDSDWEVSKDKLFGDNTTRNGGICHCQNGTTRHWLLVC